MVVHLSADSPGVLDQILNRTAAVPVVLPRGGERLRAGHAYVAPPDYHLVVEPGTLRLTRGPRENRFRPAIDPLFRSVARVYGPAAIGVVLTGNLDDGTAGLQAIKQLGGTAVVQDPADAMYPSMPRNALRHVPIDYSVPLGEMAALLTRLVSADVHAPSAPEASGPVDVEVRIAKEENPLQAGLAGLGTPSYFTCPECHGVLLEIGGSPLLRYRCHTGHAFSAEALVASLSESIEKTLWNALRAAEEGSLLAAHMAGHAREHGDAEGADLLESEASELREQTERLRGLLRGRGALTTWTQKAG